MIILSILFFVTALIYSSVGFGGGSTYLALLLLWGIPYQIFPLIALACNIIVVSGNSFNYIRAGNLNFKLLLPYLVGSIPFAFIGGSVQIEKELFEIILFFVLGIAGVLLLVNFKSYDNDLTSYKTLPVYIAALIGIVLGFVSGIVGIGGGIFLSPILYLFRAANPKHITTTVSLFILINSVFGIVGQLTKNNNMFEVKEYLYLLLAVFIGGQIGNFINLKLLSAKILALITSILVIFVAIRMGINIFGFWLDNFFMKYIILLKKIYRPFLLTYIFFSIAISFYPSFNFFSLKGQLIIILVALFNGVLGIYIKKL